MKKILTFIFVALLPLVASAYDAEIDGIYYNFSGDEAEVTYETTSYRSYSGDVVIPESVSYNSKTYSVTSIGRYAFQYCDELTSITIPNSVTSIFSYAFSGCTSLTSVTIPNSVTRIGANVFERCSGLTSITIPNSVTLISDCAFFYCSGLTSITIPGSVTRIGDYAFLGCSGLTSVTIPGSVTRIGGYAFSECSGLTSINVAEGNTTYDSRNDCNAIIETATNTLIAGCQNTTIPEGVTSIDDGVFSNCSGLTSITIPNSVTSIGGWAFYLCSGLTSVTIPGSVTSIGDDAFRDCSGLTSVTIGNSVTYIGERAFEDCTSLTSITIPSSVTSIGDMAFFCCSGLTSINVAEGNTTYDSRNDCNAIIETATSALIVGCQNTTIPEDVTSIGYGVFLGCTSLTSITIPGSVTSIGSRAFGWCSGLTSVIVGRATPPSIAESTFYASNQSNATLYVPYGSKSAYEAADYWNEFNEIVEMPSVIIGSTGYATYCSEFDLDFSGVSGMKAYIASGFSPSTGKLVLTCVTEVPAGEGLYLVGEPGTYEVPFTETDMMYSNLLKGVTTATTIYPTDGDYTNFILANGSHGVAFYSLSAAGELAAGKAYLQLPTTSASDVKAISVIFDDDEDAVLSIEEDSQTQRIYNLQGQQVNAPKSGLYIVNGKKVFIK